MILTLCFVVLLTTFVAGEYRADENRQYQFGEYRNNEFRRNGDFENFQAFRRGDEECVDKLGSDACQKKAMANECQTKKDFMMANCRQMCDLC